MEYVSYVGSLLARGATRTHEPTLYFPSNAHNVKKRRVIKTF